MYADSSGSSHQKKLTVLWAELESWCLENHYCPFKDCWLFRYHTLVSCNADWYLPVRNTSKSCDEFVSLKLNLEIFELETAAKNPMIFSNAFYATAILSLQLDVLLWCFLQTQWHDLEINTYETLVGWLEPHVWKIWVKMGFLPSRGETNNFWNHHLKLHCNIGLLVDLLNICGRSCLKLFSNLWFVQDCRIKTIICRLSLHI